MRVFKIVLVCLLAAIPLWSQQAKVRIDKTFTWKASTSGWSADNPIRYRFYKCPNPTWVNCEVIDAGTALQARVTFNEGTWYTCITSYRNVMSVDNIFTGDIAEGAPSNWVKITIELPPATPNLLETAPAKK